MSEIATYTDLLAEKKRLEDHLAVKRAVINQELVQLKEELRPTFQLVSAIHSVGRNSLPPLLSVGLTIAGEVLLLRTRLPIIGNKLARLVLPFIGEKLSAMVRRKDRNAPGTV